MRFDLAFVVGAKKEHRHLVRRKPVAYIGHIFRRCLVHRDKNGADIQKYKVIIGLPRTPYKLIANQGPYSVSIRKLQTLEVSRSHQQWVDAAGGAMLIGYARVSRKESLKTIGREKIALQTNVLIL